MKLKSGIANSLTHDVYLKDNESTSAQSHQFVRGQEHVKGTKILPFDVTRLNGIVPQHDISWAEIAIIAGQSHTTCREHCE